MNTLHSHTPLYTLCTKKREEERKEKVCLCGVHVTTCQMFVWVLRGVLPHRGVHVSPLTYVSQYDESNIKLEG